MFNQPGLRALNLQKVKLLDRVAMRNAALANEIRNLKLDWYAIRNQSDADGPAEIFIYDEIGGSFGYAATDFIDDLNAIDNPEIIVRINSPGGMVTDAIAIASSIAQHPSHITTRVDGMAASAASIIAVAGDRVEMCEGSQKMIHDAMVNVQANPRELREAADWLDEQSDNIAKMYAAKAGGDWKDWRAKMSAETWMFAEEAVNVGLADGIFMRDKKMPMKPDETDPDEMEEEEDTAAITSEALNLLMNRQHRLTNRGFKYLGRNKAPSPATNKSEAISDDDKLNRFINAMQTTLGGKR